MALLCWRERKTAVAPWVDRWILWLLWFMDVYSSHLWYIYIYTYILYHIISTFSNSLQSINQLRSDFAHLVDCGSKNWHVEHFHMAQEAPDTPGEQISILQNWDELGWGPQTDESEQTSLALRCHHRLFLDLLVECVLETSVDFLRLPSILKERETWHRRSNIT